MSYPVPDSQALRKAGMRDVPFDWQDALRLEDLLTEEERHDPRQRRATTRRNG